MWVTEPSRLDHTGVTIIPVLEWSDYLPLTLILWGTNYPYLYPSSEVERLRQTGELWGAPPQLQCHDASVCAQGSGVQAVLPSREPRRPWWAEPRPGTAGALRGERNESNAGEEAGVEITNLTQGRRRQLSGHSTSPRATLSGFKAWPHWLAVWPQSCHLTSQCLHFSVVRCG